MAYLEQMKPENIPAVSAPVIDCCYCWYVVHPAMPFPESWSSTICDGHSAWLLAQLARRRDHRLGRATARSEASGSAVSIIRRR